MRFQQLECLLAVADTESYYEAAQKTMYPQNIIIKCIQELEGGLGHPLVQVEDKVAVLTSQGMLVEKYARVIVQQVTELYDIMDAQLFSND